MTDLGHTPRRDPQGGLLKYKADWWYPGPIRPSPDAGAVVGLICTACGCFYVQMTAHAVCPNRIMEVLKERML